MAETKTCTTCGQTKPLEAYPQHYAAPQGRAAKCRLCKRQVDAVYQATKRRGGMRRRWRETL
jgi:hypothetical protein